MYYELGKDAINDMSGYQLIGHFMSKYTTRSSKISTIIRASMRVLKSNPSWRLKEDEPTTKKPLFKVKNVD